MLAAPEEAISDRLGVLPADVSAPDTALPGLDANEVLAPLDEETAPQDEAQAPQAAPANSAAAFSLDPLAAPAALGDSQASPAPSQAAAPLDLAAPESALPETVTSADAANVSAPQSQTGSVDTPVSDASEVTAPGVSEAPQVGASPSSGAIDVAAPSELTPSLPTPITSTAEPITNTAPPIGWEGAGGGEDVEVFGACENSYGGNCVHGNTPIPTNLDREAAENENEVETLTGADKDDDPTPKPDEQPVRNEIKAELPDVDEHKVDDFVDAVIEVIESQTGSSLTVAERVTALKEINAMVASGQITGDLVEAFANIGNSAAPNRWETNGQIPMGPGVAGSNGNVQGATLVAGYGGWRLAGAGGRWVTAGGITQLDGPLPVGDVAAIIFLIGTEIYLSKNSDDSSNAPAITGSTAGNTTTPPDPDCPEGVDCDDSKESDPQYSVGEKIQKQMKKRGWNDELIKDTLKNPAEKVATRDTRYAANGTRLNDPATGYVRSDGSYIVRNDVTRDIVQVSNRTKPGWKAPWSVK